MTVLEAAYLQANKALAEYTTAHDAVLQLAEKLGMRGAYRVNDSLVVSINSSEVHKYAKTSAGRAACTLEELRLLLSEVGGE